MAIEGPLRELGIHDVFQLLDLSRKTGVLRVRSALRQNAGTVYFESGAVIGAEIRSNPHPLGGLLLKSGKVSEEELARVRALQEAGDTRRLGDLLVESGTISRREVDRIIRRQTEEVVFELLGWSEGYFSFEEGDPTRMSVEAAVRIPTEALVMEAARRIDEWSRIETRIPHLGIVARLAPVGTDAGPLDLMPFEWEVLAAIDGTRDVHDLSTTLNRSEFEVAKTLFGLATAGIILLEDTAAAAPSGDGTAGGGLTMAVARAEEDLAAGRVEAALVAAGDAAVVHPDQPLAHLVLARVLLAAGRAAEALAAAERALQIDPALVAAHRHAGTAAARLGRFRSAREHWEQWLGARGQDEMRHDESVRAARDAAGTLEHVLRGLSG